MFVNPIPPFHEGHKCDDHEWSAFQFTRYVYHSNEFYVHIIIDNVNIINPINIKILNVNRIDN